MVFGGAARNIIASTKIRGSTMVWLWWPLFAPYVDVSGDSFFGRRTYHYCLLWVWCPFVVVEGVA